MPVWCRNIRKCDPKSELELPEVVKVPGFIDRRKGFSRPTKREGREL